MLSRAVGPIGNKNSPHGTIRNKDSDRVADPDPYPDPD